LDETMPLVYRSYYSHLSSAEHSFKSQMHKGARIERTGRM